MPLAEDTPELSDRLGGDGHAEPTRVLIIEDHRVVAEGLAALINSQDDMTVVGSVGTVAESAEAAAALDPEVVLLDFRLPDGGGPDAAAAIRSIRPAARMIFLTREDTESARFAAVTGQALSSTSHGRPPRWSPRSATLPAARCLSHRGRSPRCSPSAGRSTPSSTA